MKTAILAGPVTNPKPMNPASTIYREPNPHIINIPHGAYIMINAAGDAETWRQWSKNQKET